MKLPKVTLLSWPMFPIETVYCLWHASRSNDPLPIPRDVASRRMDNPILDAEVEKLFTDVALSGIPVGESLNFVFMLENVTVSFREQMVRHRIGMKFGERLGVDIVPDLASSTWWSQTSRVLDQREFANEGRYTIPESLAGKKLGREKWEAGKKVPPMSVDGLNAEDVYKNHMELTAHTYKRLIEAGVPIEDAREVLPSGIQHRLSWTLNLSAIKHVVGKRSCWVAQSGHWFPIITGMIEELCTKVDPIFRRLVDPPCFSKGKWDGCKVPFEEMSNRIKGSDEIPPCPLFLSKHPTEAGHMADKGSTWWPTPAGWCCDDNKRVVRNAKMRNEYGALWNRDPSTGDQR